mgnify:FL=1|tara:strand:- start:889 stop:1014 length:126 start_codon:yes stop_codon:yes gene_type:complete
MKRKNKPKNLESINWDNKIEKLKLKFNRNKDKYNKHKNKDY